VGGDGRHCDIPISDGGVRTVKRGVGARRLGGVGSGGADFKRGWAGWRDSHSCHPCAAGSPIHRASTVSPHGVAPCQRRCFGGREEGGHHGADVIAHDLQGRRRPRLDLPSFDRRGVACIHARTQMDNTARRPSKLSSPTADGMYHRCTLNGRSGAAAAAARANSRAITATRAIPPAHNSGHAR